MERGILIQPDVAQLLRRFDLLEIFTDGQGEEPYARVQREITGMNANPTYIVLDSEHGREVARTSFTNSAEEFKEFLRKGLTDEPAFQSRVQFGKLISLDPDRPGSHELAPVGSLVSDPGVETEYLGETAYAYRGPFEASQGFRLPADLAPGPYRLEGRLVTAVYDGERWLEAVSLPVRMPLTIQ